MPGEAEDGVAGQEGVGEHEPAVGGVVEAALEPLRRGVDRTVQRVGHDPARQAAHALGAHRVALVGHRRRADLVLVERLRELAHPLQEAQVGAHLVAALGDAGEGGEHLAVELAGVGLAGDRHRAGEPEPGGDPGVELADLGMVAGEQGEEARLRAGGPLDSAAAQRRQPVVDLGQVEDEVVRPQAGALADGRQLRRLEVGVGETGQGAVARGEGGEAGDRRRDPARAAARAPRASAAGRCCR